MLNPYLLLGLAIFWAVSCAGAYFKGRSAGSESVQIKWDKAIADQRDREQAATQAASTKLESGNAKAKVVYRTITQTVDKVVEKPVYRSICLDDDGLRVANEALTGTLAPAAKPDKPMPRPDAPRLRNGSGSVAQIGGSE